MAIELKDLQRYFPLEANANTLRAGMFGAASDTKRFIVRNLADSSLRYWSDDSKQLLLDSPQTVLAAKTFTVGPLINDVLTTNSIAFSSELSQPDNGGANEGAGGAVTLDKEGTVLFDPSAANVSFYNLAVSAKVGRQVVLRNTSAYTVTLGLAASMKDGAALVIAPNKSVSIMSDGADWWKLDSASDGDNVKIAGSEWTNIILPDTGNWRGLARGNGLFVMVGDDRIYTSPDGEAWTERTNPTSDYYNDVIYANGRFVAVAVSGAGNRIIYSNDGKTWVSALTVPQSNSFKSITYGLGLYVLVSSDGTNRVMTSPDGDTWTVRVAAEANAWTSITFYNNLFVAVSTDGTNRVMTSPDAITWTARSAAEANSYQSITAGNGLYLAVSSDGTNRVMTSPDATTWTARAASVANSWLAVKFGGGIFVACSNSGTLDRIMTSPDGITWTTRVTPADTPYDAIVYHDGLFLCAAASISNGLMKSGVLSQIETPYDNIFQGDRAFIGEIAFKPFNVDTLSINEGNVLCKVPLIMENNIQMGLNSIGYDASGALTFDASNNCIVSNNLAVSNTLFIEHADKYIDRSTAVDDQLRIVNTSANGGIVLDDTNGYILMQRAGNIFGQFNPSEKIWYDSNYAPLIEYSDTQRELSTPDDAPRVTTGYVERRAALSAMTGGAVIVDSFASLNAYSYIVEAKVVITSGSAAAFQEKHLLTYSVDNNNSGSTIATLMSSNTHPSSPIATVVIDISGDTVRLSVTATNGYHCVGMLKYLAINMNDYVPA